MDNIKTKFKSFLWNCFKKLVKWVALNAFRAALVIIGYTLHIINVLSEWGILITAFVGSHFGVNFNGIVTSSRNEEARDQSFEQKFSKEDIEQIASSVNPDAKIKEIEEGLGVSYRQARKIQQAAKNPLSIRHYSFADKLA